MLSVFYLIHLYFINKTDRDAVIQKWYDKTRLITGKSFQSLEKPILQQIEHVNNSFFYTQSIIIIFKNN